MPGETNTNALPAGDGPVLLGYVPTEEGRAAFEVALAEARKNDTHVLLVNSSHGGAYTDSQLATDQDLQALVTEGAAVGVEVEVLQQPRGADPADTVLDAVEQSGACLLVIGMRRRSPVGKLFLGSTAQTLLLHSPVPVLAVKAGTQHTTHPTPKDRP